MRDRRGAGRRVGLAGAPSGSASTSSRRRWPDCWRCWPAWSRSSAWLRAPETRAVPWAPVDPEPGEQVFFHGHPSWRSMVAFYIRGLLAAIVAGVIAGVVTRLAERRRARPAGLAGRAARDLRDRARVGPGQADRHDLHDHEPAPDDRRRGCSRARCTRRGSSASRTSTRASACSSGCSGVGTVDFDTAGGAAYDFSFRGVADPRADRPHGRQGAPRAPADPPPGYEGARDSERLSVHGRAGEPGGGAEQRPPCRSAPT